MRFPVGFLASAVAVADSLAVTAEFECVALGARGVAVGACLGRHGTEIGWVGSVAVVVLLVLMVEIVLMI
jgi:hypothetical protein